MELKGILGFDGRYGVTRDGEVWNYISEKFLKPTLNLNGYCDVNLYIDRIRKRYLVHRLVMATWGDLDINDTQTVVHHINGDPLDNRLDNLQIMSDYGHRCSHKKGYGIDTETHKFCTKCEILKLRSKFNVSRNNSDGLNNWCKSCCKDYYQQNKEAILQRKKRHI